MVNYALGKIYKIVCNKTGLVYVGSTCEPTLARRLAKHVGDYKEFLNGRNKFITSIKIIENNDYDIVLIEDCPCVTKDQLHKRERFYIESIQCVNKYIPTRTHKEYANERYQKNKDKFLEQMKLNYIEHKNEILEYHKSYYHKNKDIINEKQDYTMKRIKNT